MTYRMWVGIDWGSEEHEVVLLDAEGKQIGRKRVKHDGDALPAMVDWLLSHVAGDVGALAACLETPHGSVVEALMDKDIAVYAINPKQADRFRDRHSVAGAKCDGLDAHSMADGLRTDISLFRRVKAGPATLVQLREATRLHDDLTREKQALINQMRDALHRYFPQFLLLGDLDAQWVWTLVTAIPTPQAAQKAAAKTAVRNTLQSCRVRKFTADVVLEFLRRTPVPVAPGVTEAARMRLDVVLPRLKQTHQLLVDCNHRMAALLEQHEEEDQDAGQKPAHRDVDIILSLPGTGTYTAATMLSDAWEALAEKDYQAIRTRTGAAPVTRQSGKQHSANKRGRHRPQVCMRRACNPRLRNAVHHVASVAMQSDPHAKQLYANARARGCNHGHALRIVGDRLLGVLIGMLKSRTIYDAGRWLNSHTPEAK